MNRRWWGVGWALALTVGCGPSTVGFDARPDQEAPSDVADGGVDSTSPDASSDAPTDAARDTILDAPRDAPADAATDASTDAAMDARTDAAPDAAADARMDSSPDVSVDAASDARADAAADVAADANTDGASASDASGTRTLECAPVVPTGASSGLVCSAIAWPGFRFEVTGASSVRLVEIGLQAAVDGTASGSLHASVVRLTSASDAPDSPDLSSADVLLHALISFPAGGPATTQRTAVDATLAPGWYAVVYGAGAFGATAPSATVPSAGGTGCTLAGSGYPFTIRQSDGMLILQGAVPHMFVTVSP